MTTTTKPRNEPSRALAPQANASLAMGLVGLLALGLITGIPAIRKGRAAQRDIQKSEGRLGGNQRAAAGIVTGALGTLWSVVLLVLVVIEMLSQPFDWGGILSNSVRGMFGPEAAIYALAAVGLNIHFGYTGLLNFGQVGFMMVGAYGVAVSVATFGWPLWAGVLVGIGCAVVLALILGIPTLRLRGDYLAIATIAAGEVLRFIYRSEYAEPLTGGVFGLRQFADGFFDLSPIEPGVYGWGPVDFDARSLWVMVVGWTMVALACLLVWLLVHSPWGRVLRSVREDELAARSLGKNVFSFKIQSLVLGGVLGALAGALLAINVQSVQPDSYNPVITFYLYVIVILGGAARILGPVLGSIVFWFVLTFFDAFLRQATSTGFIPSSVIDGADVGALRFALVGLGLILLMAFRPAGILGDTKELRLDVR